MAKSKTATPSDQDWKYKVEDGARTLMKAEEIKEDPKLYKACFEEMEKQMAALSMAMGRGGRSLMDSMDKQGGS